MSLHFSPERGMKKVLCFPDMSAELGLPPSGLLLSGKRMWVILHCVFLCTLSTQCVCLLTQTHNLGKLVTRLSIFLMIRIFFLVSSFDNCQTATFICYILSSIPFPLKWLISLLLDVLSLHLKRLHSFCCNFTLCFPIPLYRQSLNILTCLSSTTSTGPSVPILPRLKQTYSCQVTNALLVAKSD